MKKIGIITIFKVNNYGAELQAFALQYKINSMGYSCELIDYLFYKHEDFKYTKKSMPTFKLSLKKRLKEILVPIANKYHSITNKKNKKLREENFLRFYTNYCKFSRITYDTIDSLYSETFDYDCFIVGSDQVWNPNINASIEPYYLTFAPKHKKKFSYASSFGVSYIPTEYQNKYRELINNLDSISVREVEGVDLIRKITGKESVHVVDPTLLLTDNDWMSVATFPKNNAPYLLLYVLTSSSYITRLAKKISQDLGIAIIRICKTESNHDSDSNIVNVTDAGPSEFIGLFMKASFILTNSFHGTTFSVLFQKPFFTVLPRNKTNNCRQQGFLFSIGLDRRILNEGASFPVIADYQIDFSEAIFKLKEFRKRSEQFLFNELSSIDE